MKNTIKRITAIVVVCVMMFSSAVLAAERASYYISYKGGGITPTGDGNMRIVFTVTATGMMDKLGAYSVCIYNEDDVEQDCIYYTDPGCSDMMTTNDYSWDGEVYWQGVSGERYYAVITFYAKNSSGDDYRSYITSEVTV